MNPLTDCVEMLSGVRQGSHFWRHFVRSDRTVQTFDKILSNKDGYCSNSIYKFNGAIKAIYVKKFLKNKSFFSDKTITYVMPKSRSIDIDTNLDFVIAEYLINHTKK